MELLSRVICRFSDHLNYQGDGVRLYYGCHDIIVLVGFDTKQVGNLFLPQVALSHLTAPTPHCCAN